MVFRKSLLNQRKHPDGSEPPDNAKEQRVSSSLGRGAFGEHSKGGGPVQNDRDPRTGRGCSDRGKTVEQFAAARDKARLSPHLLQGT